MNSQNKISRRKLLQSAAVGGGAVMVTGLQLALAGDKATEQVQKQTRPLNEFEEVLKRCGSEFGDVKDAFNGTGNE